MSVKEALRRHAPWNVGLAILLALTLAISVWAVASKTIHDSDVASNAAPVVYEAASGGPDSKAANDTTVTELWTNESAVTDGGLQAADADASVNSPASSANERKLVYSGSARCIVQDVDAAIAGIEKHVADTGGWIESKDVSDGHASLGVRVPVGEFDAAMAFLESIGDGDESSVSVHVDDLSRSYADNNRRIAALSAEHDELMRLLESAETVEDVIAVRDRLASLDYEMRAYEESNAGIDYDASWASINVAIEKLRAPGTVEKDSFWEEAVRALETGWELALGCVLAIVALWPLWAVVAIVCVIVAARHMRRRHESAKAGKRAGVSAADAAGIKNGDEE